ncbi:MAG: TolC family outer membrane protein [Rhodospirillales bacterium]|nr:TolC family outer membrane protein [Rhodospirillales bacterium]
MIRTFIWALGALLAGASGSYGTTLESELAGLILDHPQIRAASKTLEAERQGIAIANAGYLPTISSTSESGHEVVDSPGTRDQGDGQGGKPSSRTTYSQNLTVTQNLFNGYQTTALARTARLNKEIARIEVENTRQSTTFSGITTYINVLRQKRLIELARENEATIQRQLNLEDERVQRGSGVAVDVLQAKSRLQIAKERRVTFEGAMIDAISRYSGLYDHPPDVEAMLDPVPPVDLIPSTLDHAIEIGLNENPSLESAGTTVEVARERQKSIRGQLFPSLDLEGQANYEKHANTVTGTRRDYAVTLRASWDLFSGLSTPASLTQAKFQYRATQDEQDRIRRGVIEQTKLSWQALLTAKARLDLLENAVNIASEVFASRKKLREAGKENVINVLDAENEVNSAQINFTSASYDERVAVYQLLLAIGRLTPAYLRLTPP